MSSNPGTVADYLASLPPDRRQTISAIRSVILKHLPPGFQECIQYGMIAYVVPHQRYPSGYHVNPKEPLPFLSLASQKSHIALYHMALYADPVLMDWFMASYVKAGVGKPDIGKSCIRFKNPERIPLALIGDLVSRVSVADWIGRYETMRKRE
ncbi:MAG: hypothetical protein RJA57_176 [Bacteroidota bacterium]|jgi:uncharacterized protein YdhG (YjbR/CyaY superfamily)